MCPVCRGDITISTNKIKDDQILNKANLEKEYLIRPREEISEEISRIKELDLYSAKCNTQNLQNKRNELPKDIQSQNVEMDTAFFLLEL